MKLIMRSLRVITILIELEVGAHSGIELAVEAAVRRDMTQIIPGETTEAIKKAEREGIVMVVAVERAEAPAEKVFAVDTEVTAEDILQEMIGLIRDDYMDDPVAGETEIPSDTDTKEDSDPEMGRDGEEKISRHSHREPGWEHSIRMEDGGVLVAPGFSSKGLMVL